MSEQEKVGSGESRPQSRQSGRVTPDPSQIVHYRDAGLELIPLHRYDHVDDRGRPRGKSPRDNAWPVRDYTGFDAEAHMAEGYNVGVRLSAEWVVLDADPRNYPEGRDSLDELAKLIGYADGESFCNDNTHVVSGSGGFHVYMRKAPETSFVPELKDTHPGIEFKSLGRQVVAAGSIHPDTLKLYTWGFFALPLSDARMAPKSLIEIASRKDAAASSSGPGLKLSVAQVRHCLGQLPPERFGAYEDWLKVGMACHAATNGDPDALDAWIEWSTDPGDAEYKWTTFNANRPGAKLTGASLLRMVEEHGGSLPANELDEGEFEPVDDADGQETRAPSKLEEMNKRFAVVNANGFRILREQRDPILKRPCYAYMTKSDFCYLMMNQIVEVPKSGGGSRLMTAGEWWLGQPGRRQFEGVHFDPEQDHEGWLNLWRGWAVEPKPGGWSLLEELVREVLCAGDKASFEYVLNWSAHMVQHPAKPAEVALAFRGAKGTGKGTFGRALVSLAGTHGLHISSPAHLTGRFNSHLRDCVCLFADEAFWAGDKAGESVLKQLITEPTLAYEAKGRDVESGRNMIHIVIASNSDWVVPAGMDGERRFAVFEATDARQSDHAFFAELDTQLKRGGLAGMLHDLLRRDLRGWAPRQGIPQTAALADQKLRSMDKWQSWWYGLLSRGALPNQRSDWATAETTVVADYLRRDYEVACRDAGVGRPGSPDQLGRWLHKNVPGILRKQVAVLEEDHGVHVTTGNRVTAYIVPSLAKCRTAFDKALGRSGGWPEE